MKRYLINFSYIGTSYRGSQKHSSKNIIDVDSVQGSIESSLHVLIKNFKTPPAIVMAGRTDAGVHALKSTAHFDIEQSEDTYINGENTTKLMNRYMINCGHDIRIMNCYEVSPNFHARYSAKSRTYLYRFVVAKDPTNHKVPIAELNRSMHINIFPKKIDIDRMRQALELFKGTKDFRSFTTKSLNNKFSEHDDNLKSYRKTLDVRMEEAKPLMPFDVLAEHFHYWHLTFTSKSFLYNQIRRIVGVLVALGSNRISEKDIITMLQVPSHRNWNQHASPAPPHGLYLQNVEYEKDDIKEICSASN